MAFLDDLFRFATGGRDEESSATEVSQQEQEQRRTVAQAGGTARRVGEIEATQRDLRFLDPRAEALGITGLERLGALDTERLGTQSDFLFNRAAGTQDFVAGLTQPIIGEARRRGEDELGRLVTREATRAGAGSRTNTLVATAEAEGRADLETQLASLEAQLGLQGRQLESTDLLAAFGAERETFGAGTERGGEEASLITALRGAIETGDIRGERQTAEDQRTLLTELVQQLTETRTSGSTSGRSSTSGNLENIIDALDTFLNIGGRGS